MSWQEISSLASKGGWFLLAVVLYIVIFHYDKLGVIISDLYRLLAWSGKFFQKKYVALDIQSRINLGIKKLNRETRDLMPLSLEIKWVKPEEIDREVFIKEGSAILRLDYYLNQDKNLTNVVQEFVTKVHLRESKAYLPQKLGQSVDLRLTARYLKECGRREALNYFV